MCFRSLFCFFRTHPEKHACSCSLVRMTFCTFAMYLHVCLTVCVCCSRVGNIIANFGILTYTSWQWRSRNCNETDNTHFLAVSNTHLHTHTPQLSSSHSSVSPSPLSLFSFSSCRVFLLLLSFSIIASRLFLTPPISASRLSFFSLLLLLLVILSLLLYLFLWYNIDGSNKQASVNACSVKLKTQEFSVYLPQLSLCVI